MARRITSSAPKLWAKEGKVHGDAANVLVIGSYAIETPYLDIVDGERVGWMK